MDWIAAILDAGMVNRALSKGLCVLLRVLLFCSLVMTVSSAMAAENATSIAAERSTVADPWRYLPLMTDYAAVPSPMPVYNSPTDVREHRIARYHGEQGVWVSVRHSKEIGAERYHRVRWNWNRVGWMAADALQFRAILSPLRGVDLRARPGEKLAMVFVDSLNVRSEPGVIAEHTWRGVLEKYSLVLVREVRGINNSVWYRIDEDAWIHSAYVRRFVPGPRPEGVGPDEKWIEVNVAEQFIVAHVGDQPVFATLTSTGRPGRETILGLHRIWVKLTHAPLAAVPGADPPYDLADVPYVMYFHGGYGVHGGYWHDDFGRVRSNGCVNLSPHDAQWFFNFAGPRIVPPARAAFPTEEEPGTWIFIH